VAPTESPSPQPTSVVTPDPTVGPTATATPSPTQSPAPAPARPAPSLAAGGLAGGGLTGLQPLRPFGGASLTGLPTSTDQQPQCRAQCAKNHNQCAGGNDDDCDNRWQQCVAACRTAK
jgi:hypothetical protein